MGYLDDYNFQIGRKLFRLGFCILKTLLLKNGFKKRISELEKFLQEFEFELTEYDEQLVRGYIQKITVYDERYEVEFKAGFELDIER